MAESLRLIIADDVASIKALWKRDLTRFFREKSRIAGALIQPLIFWLLIGTGMSPAFHIGGKLDVSYLEFFFPGVLLMVVLFTTIFATMSVIEDRHNGFLQGVLVAPGSRIAAVAGKSLGAASIAVLQAVVFCLLAPAAGFDVGSVAWLSLLASLIIAAFGLSAFGFAIAWWLDSVQSYHVLMSIVLIPAWILSGAMFPVIEIFPVDDSNWVVTLARFNPLTYAVDAVRHALYGQSILSGDASRQLMLDWLVLVAFAFASLCLAAGLCYKRR